MPRLSRIRLERRDWSDQAASDGGRSASHGGQVSSDSDQGRSDEDQFSSQSDQLLSDRDQEVADLEFRSGAGTAAERARAYELSQERRGQATSARTVTSAIRARVSLERDTQAVARDEIARLRDENAAARDAAADFADREAAELAGSLGETDERTQVALAAAAAARVRAAAARDRAAGDRRQAARDRDAAARDREQLQAEVRLAQIDELTGAFRRGIGEVLISHEIERAKRSGSQLQLAFIDVDRLKEANDTLGHAAGDSILRCVFAGFRVRLRPYDPIIRWGGDEFVCMISGAAPEDALNRIAAARSDLSGLDPVIEVSFGLATMVEGDTMASLVGRADTALLEARTRRGR
jgi:diguanylate cyclase (GGDEF)-like protein